MLKNTLGLILAAGGLTLAACLPTEKSTDSTEPGTEQPGTETGDTSVPWSFSTSWVSDCDLDVEIVGGSGSYNLGMAQTGDGEAGWYGEDCSVEGLCHPLDATLSLASVHPDCGGDGIDAIVEGSTTLFKASHDTRISYAIFDADYNLVDCAGDDCSYFDE